jgi:hypothetical protein
MVRCGPARISINTNTTLKDIYIVNANNQKSGIYNFFKYFFKVLLSMTTIDKKIHSFKRRVNTRALSGDAIKALEKLVLRNTRIFCEILDDTPA